MVRQCSFTSAIYIHNVGQLRITSGTITWQSNVLVEAGARLDLEIGRASCRERGELSVGGVVRKENGGNGGMVRGSGRIGIRRVRWIVESVDRLDGEHEL